MDSTNSKTVWTVSMDAGTGSSPVGQFKVAVNDGTATSFAVKGMCYSPCPINGSNGDAPALGDWFWDSFSGTGFSITGWNALWDRDFPNLRKMGVNALRVYSTLSRQLNADGSYPSPWNSGQLFTHTDFLDKCWNNGDNPMYVMVGIPMPQQMFWKNLYNTLGDTEKTFWTNVLQETVAQMADHPAVMGFVVQNEMDSGVVTYGPNTEYVEFWWSQVENMAKIAKTAAPNKLVGMAVHDDNNICGQASQYMAKCPSVDYWGVNTYQTENFNSVFGTTPEGPGYAGVTGSALKPVVLSEYGLPCSGRDNMCDPTTIASNDSMVQNTATVVSKMIPQAYDQSVCVGMFYFEYCDEFWNQNSYKIADCGTTEFKAPNAYTWYGGPYAPGFPNKYWDQMGFGVFHPSRGTGLSPNSPIWSQNGGTGGPNTPVDVMTARDQMVSTITTAFAAVVEEVV